VLLSGQVGLAGSTVLGDGVVMGGRSGSSGHLEIGAGTQVAGTSVVMQSVPAGQKLGGLPAMDLKAWRRQVKQLGRLDDFVRRLRAIERRLGVEPRADDAAPAGAGDEPARETT
jgi:UDP-3-O-[3-hydroxymyristoyl] glucosamine N-acyltransferase